MDIHSDEMGDLAIGKKWCIIWRLCNSQNISRIPLKDESSNCFVIFSWMELVFEVIWFLFGAFQGDSKILTFIYNKKQNQF